METLASASAAASAWEQSPRGIVNNESDIFGRRLSKLRRAWQGGLLLQLALRAAGWLVMLVVIGAVLDYFLALEPVSRAILAAGAGLLLAARTVAWTLAVLRLGDRQMAERADAAAASRRRPVLSALELIAWLRARPASGDGGLPGYLVARSVDGATTSLQQLPFRLYFPVGGIARQSRVLFAQCLCAFVILGSNLAASRVVLARWAFPYRDIPPYSRLVFAIAPASPDVLYGGTADIAVTITGAPVESSVWFVTRSGADRHRVPCFQETDQRYAQRLEKVVTPVEFCFSTGKARSRWHKVNLMLDPKISMAAATLIPPPYSRLPRRQFIVGQEELIGLRQSEVELTIGSNRPLQDGRLRIRPLDDTGPGTVVDGVRTGPRSLSFRWSLQYPAELDISIRDLMGTRNIDPFRVQQKLATDQPPAVSFTSPPGFALATPSVSLPLAARAEDDLGLNRVELLHTVVGYRDRARSIPIVPGERNHSFSETIDLKTLGVEPGQVLEFYLEAIDSNPAMTGIGMSEIVRVQIISENEYAAMIRSRITLEEFMGRYRALAGRINRLEAALRELQTTAEDPRSTPEARRAALDRARSAMREAGKAFEQAARDFPAFEVERKLVGAMAALAAKSSEWAAQLDQAPTGGPELAAMASGMLAALGRESQPLQKQTRDAERLTALARVMESAIRLRQIAARQEDLVRRLSRFEKETRASELATLPAHGARQEEIRKDLVAWKKDLAGQLEALPDAYKPLRDKLQALVKAIGDYEMATSDEFQDAKQNYEIPGLMGKAAHAAGLPQGPPAHRYASLALERLQNLLGKAGDKKEGGDDGQKECEGMEELFRRLARGDGAGEGNCGPGGLQDTFNQLIQSLLMRGSGQNGPQLGQGGTGAGGDASSGYWMPSQSMLNVPAFGPGRASALSLSGSADGSGPGMPGQGGPSVKPRHTENMNIEGRTDVKSESMPMESIPEKYRNAVRRYFSSQ